MHKKLWGSENTAYISRKGIFSSVCKPSVILSVLLQPQVIYMRAYRKTKVKPHVLSFELQADPLGLDREDTGVQYDFWRNQKPKEEQEIDINIWMHVTSTTDEVKETPKPRVIKSNSLFCKRLILSRLFHSASLPSHPVAVHSFLRC